VPTGSTPPNGGISFENWAGASKQKLLLAVGLQGFTLPLGPQGLPTLKGVFALPSSAVLKPAQAGLVKIGMTLIPRCIFKQLILI
jgi:hypothetical protein